MQIFIINAFSFDSLKKIVNFGANYNLKPRNMEDLKKKNGVDMNDKEIIFSKAIKAGKRIYYLDVKKNRKDEMFLAITESKKIITGEGDDAQVSFEKHKIFLYKEDFEKFMTGLHEAIAFVNDGQEKTSETASILEKEDKETESDGEIKIDIDFGEPIL